MALVVDARQVMSIHAYSLRYWRATNRVLGWWGDYLVIMSPGGVLRALRPSKENPGLWIPVYAVFDQEDHRLARQLMPRTVR